MGVAPVEYLEKDVIIMNSDGYVGYDASEGMMQGQAEAVIRIYFDGKGHWRLLTAFPDAVEMQFFP